MLYHMSTGMHKGPDNKGKAKVLTIILLTCAIEALIWAGAKALRVLAQPSRRLSRLNLLQGV